MFSNFRKANEYLESFLPENLNYSPQEVMKLDRINYLLKLLGDPHKKFKSIHVGGTSGKGSVSYFLSALLAGQGYKTGLTISPHLETVAERFQINGSEIAEKEFVNLTNKVKPLIEKTETDLHLGKPTYFEVLVAMAFDYFAKQSVGIAVVEVGLGGTLDATNVIKPTVSIITNVSLDHTDILGDTVEKIARDKSGIIKNGSPVISGARQSTVKKIIAKKSAKNNSKILFIGEKFNYKLKKVSLSGTNFDFYWLGKYLNNLKLSTPAAYQVENASLALAAINLLKDSFGFDINEEKLSKSLEKIKIPGRFEIVKKSPLIILDGAHNPAKIKTFLSSLTLLIPNRRFIFILAFKKGKDIENMLRRISPHAETIVLTQFSKVTDMGSHFATPTVELENILKKLKFPRKILIEKNSAKALTKAKKLYNKNTPTVVTGSLYLVGEIRDLFYK